MRKTINIDFDNSSSIILGYDPNILSLSSSGFAASTHIHGGVNLELTNITLVQISIACEFLRFLRLLVNDFRASILLMRHEDTNTGRKKAQTTKRRRRK